MPVISVKVEGTTKMIRTVLPNLAQVRLHTRMQASCLKSSWVGYKQVVTSPFVWECLS